MSLIIHNSRTVFIDICSLFVTLFFFFFLSGSCNHWSTISVTRFCEGSCLEPQSASGALLKQLNAVFFISARKPGVCARGGFTPASPRGALQSCTERYGETAQGIRTKGHFFAGAGEALLRCGGGAGQREEWQWEAGGSGNQIQLAEGSIPSQSLSGQCLPARH